MTKNIKLTHRILCVLLCMALLLAYIPIYAANVSAAATGENRIADPNTMDNWKQFFGPEVLSTDNAGGIWTDKSVLTDTAALSGITMDSDNFLVALSAIASNMTVTGMNNKPTDTVLVLDVSGSMNDNTSNNDVAEELVQAANVTIGELLGMNENSRVGVILYSGSSDSPTNNDAAVELLPLNRYSTAADGEYLNYTVTQGNVNYNTETISVDRDVVIWGTNTAPRYRSKTVTGATYIQKGVIAAMNMFKNSDNAAVVPAGSTVARMPVMVLLSDGAPTLGNTNFTNPGQYNLGSGSNSSAALAFVSQLSAAYAKEQIEAKYGMDCLFYTVGLGVDNDANATAVLNPSNSIASIKEFWTRYNDAAEGDPISVQSRPSRDVTRLATPLNFEYVDTYFEVQAGTDLATGLKDAFQEIVGAINLQSKYFPTLVSNDEELSGYISFVDNIGHYMTVTDVKGLYINNTLYSGATLAKNFAVGANGGDLGTPSNPTALGDELVWAVQARLGISSMDEVRTLINLAYQYGQLSYTSETEYSNYIGWYANAAGQFLGFWHEGTTTMPDPSDPSLTDATRPVYIMKSYGYLGAVDETHGVAASDMMYATVQHRTEIATGDQTMTFAVPAALIPVVTYNVTLDENQDPTDLTVTGAEHPIRLVYEVALDANINAFNVRDVVDAAYINANTDADGNISFYTNQYEADNSTGYGKINTYAYYRPSRQNDRHYYTQEGLVYSDTAGTLYSGTTKPTGTMYRQFVHYTKSGDALSKVVTYHELTADALGMAERVEGTSNWSVPQGTPRLDATQFVLEKTTNATGTLSWSAAPFADMTGFVQSDLSTSYVIGVTHGNNGKLGITPATGIRLTKELAPGAAAPAEAFLFDITHSNATFSGVYPAYLEPVSGADYETTVTFTDGKATVALHPGDVMYIGGMTAGDTLTVTEREVVDYALQSVNGTAGATQAVLTMQEQVLADAIFVNALRGKGDLTVSKVVQHDFGTGYNIPADQIFTIKVTLTGIGTANETFTAAITDGTLYSVTTDETGSFILTLAHNQQLTIFDLPEGTVATVVETDPPAGFTPTYYDNGAVGDGIVTVVADNVVSVIVRNDYAPAQVYPVNVTVSGTKTLTGRDWQADDTFTFQLQEQIGPDQWEVMSEQTVTGADADKIFDFNGAFANEAYAAAGSYYYRVVEIEPTGNLGGITYDKTVHSFTVVVGDVNMDGQLEITDVHTQRPDTTHVTAAEDGYHVTVDFTNTYSSTGSATVTIDLNKAVTNPSGSDLATLAGFTFGLYDAAGDLAFESAATTDRGFARLVMTYTEIGTYEYTLKEIVPDPVPAGWTYSSVSYKVTVVVSDDGEGGMTAVIYLQGIADGATSGISATFTNTYVPGNAQLPIDFVSKALTGRDQIAGEFKFEVRDAQTGDVILTGTNDAAGKVTFDGTLTFDKVGIYYFNIVEVGTDGNGVTMDKTTYRVTVTVTDVAGQLTATYALVNHEGNIIIFRNTYTTTPATYAISGDKTLRGRALLNDEFQFILTAALDAQGNVAQDAQTWTAWNFLDGSFVFPQITYTAAGTYYYTVHEQAAAGESYGIQYDDTVFVVTVVVTDDGKGTLSVTGVDYTIRGNGVVNHIDFVNNYVPAGTQAEIPGTKTLEGKVLGGGDYSFDLYNSNASWQQGTLIETVQNAADGTFAFAALDFDKAGTYYYLVSEQNGGQTIDGVTYDSTVFRVRVTVTDDLRGQLHAEVIVFDDGGVPQSGIQFINRYAVTGTDSVTLGGDKTLTGRDQIDGEFSFEIFATDETFVIAGDPLDTTAAMGGLFSFTLNYGPEDVGQTYYYAVREKNAGKTVNGVYHDTAIYHITVEVADDGKGGITTTTTIVKDGITATTLAFVNEYAPEPATTDISGNKVLTGNLTLGADMFSFQIFTTDETFAVTGAALQTVKNAADGTFTFADLLLPTAGTYYFVIRESSDNPVADVIYDASEYRVTIVAADNKQGGLVVESTAIIHVEGSVAASATAITFENRHHLNATTYTLSGNKILTGRDLTAGEFTFLLQEADMNFAPLAGVAPVSVTNLADGTFMFPELTFGEAKSYYYIITESSENALGGVTYDTAEYHVTVAVKSDGKTNLYVDSVTIVKVQGGTSSDAAAIAFENTYSNGTIAIYPTASKTLTGRDLTAGEFTFQLYKTGSDFSIAGLDPIGEVTNDAAGKVAFDAVTFDDPGTYYFVILEKAGTLGGVTYDPTVYRMTVVVSDNNAGALVIDSTTITKADGTAASDGAAFANSYTAAQVSTAISGTKALTGRDLNVGEFSFQLIAAGSDFVADPTATPLTAVNAADGTFAFEAITYTKAGTYYYVVTETAGTLGGVRYDPAIYRVTVTVADDGKGQLYIASTVYADAEGKTLDAIAFANTYTAAQVTTTISGGKTLTGRDMTEGEFTFRLNVADHTFTIDESVAAVTAVNTADGTFTFETLTFTKAGSYYFVITEDAGTKGGVSYDPGKFFVTIVVKDDLKGNLVVESSTIVDETGATVTNIAFENTYTASATTETLGGNKELTGRDLTAGEFTFELYKADSSFTVAPGTEHMTAVNAADGTFTFEALTFAAAGTYYYTVSESSAGALGGVSYDSRVYHVTIVVKDDLNGKLYVESTTVTDAAGSAATAMNFENSYTAASVQVTLGGTKVLEGRDLLDGEFTFQLYKTDSSFVIDAGSEPMTAVNAADGTFAFGTLTFTEAGTYYFAVVEAPGDADRVTYDATIYHVTITVTDNGIGNLIAGDPVVIKADGQAADGTIVFNNTYTPKPDDLPLTITVNKTVVNAGTESIGPEGFQFLLEGNGQQRFATSDENGIALFDLLFTELDIGKTITYTLTEVKGDREHVTYSDVQYIFAVTITLSENNELVAAITCNEVPVDAAVGAFENIYKFDLPPKTGDDARPGLWAALFAVSAGAVISVSLMGRKKEEDAEA